MLAKHPAVLLCAVVAMPDEKWGEVPCAFVEAKDGAEVTEEELIAYARERLAGFKTPKEGGVRRIAKDRHGEDPEIRAAQEPLRGLTRGGLPKPGAA